MVQSGLLPGAMLNVYSENEFLEIGGVYLELAPLSTFKLTTLFR